MENLGLIIQNDKVVVSSRKVAEIYGKRHDNVIAKIEGFIKEVPELGALNFKESSYLNSQNRKQPEYIMDRQGFSILVNKFTGVKALQFTVKYTQKFEDMSKQLQSKEKSLSPIDQLRLQYQVLEDHNEKLVKLDSKIEDLENNIPLFTIECKELQALVRKKGIKALGGYRSPAYQDNSLRGKVYADIQHQLKREFGVNRYEAIKRKQLNSVIEIVEGYKTPLVLERQIHMTNNQLVIVS